MYYFETYTDENLLIEEIVCKKLNKTINYSNIFSLLDINFNGYICLSYNPCPTNFQVHLPLLNVGNIMYIKYHDNGGNINYYYDSNDRLLNYSSQVETVHCMYTKELIVKNIFVIIYPKIMKIIHYKRL